MKALILNGKVVDTASTEFEVHSSMTWVDCEDTVKQGYAYDGSKFTSNEPTAEEIAATKTALDKKIADASAGRTKLKELGLTDDQIAALFKQWNCPPLYYQMQ